MATLKLGKVCWDCAHASAHSLTKHEGGRRRPRKPVKHDAPLPPFVRKPDARGCWAALTARASANLAQSTWQGKRNSLPSGQVRAQNSCENGPEVVLCKATAGPAAACLACVARVRDASHVSRKDSKTAAAGLLDSRGARWGGQRCLQA